MFTLFSFNFSSAEYLKSAITGDTMLSEEELEYLSNIIKEAENKSVPAILQTVLFE